MGLSNPEIVRIVTPVDYSTCADRALTWAILLARRFDASLTLLHVIEWHLHLAPAVVGDAPHPGDIEKARAALDAYVAKRLSHEIPKLERIVAIGEPHLKIREVAAQRKADLIVMGTRGKSGLADILFGSVTERVMHHTGCPVLAVPPAAEEI